MPDPISAALRMAAEHAIDVADVFNPFGDGASADPVDLRDPEYIAATLPAVKAVSDVYFRGEVEGLELPSLVAAGGRKGEHVVRSGRLDAAAHEPAIILAEGRLLQWDEAGEAYAVDERGAWVPYELGTGRP